MAMMLELLGNQVRSSHDGVEAVKAAEAFRPQVILMDVGMPRLNGYEVARRLRAQEATRGVVLIAISGYGQEEDRSRSRAAGFDHHLVKPVEPLEVEALLAQWAGSIRVVAQYHRYVFTRLWGRSVRLRSSSAA